MEITTNIHEVDLVAVALTGRLDAFESAEVRSMLTKHIDEGRCRIVVDLSTVSFVDSAGLAALIQAMKRSRELGGDVRIVRPDDAEAYRVFQLTKFDQVFTMDTDADRLIDGW